MNHSRTLRLAALTGTILVTALILAACGSSSNTTSGSAAASGTASSSSSGSASGTAARSKFAACLKSHGVTLPTRPAGQRRPNGGGEGGAPPGAGQGAGQGAGGGGGFFGGGGGKGRPGAGRFNNPKMLAALKACGGANFTQRRFTPNKAAVTKFVACVKSHGYNLPAPNFSGKGAIFPASIEKDKKFQTAAKACASDLRPQGGAGGPAPGGAGGGSSGSGSSGD
jgi:hypothetical protein